MDLDAMAVRAVVLRKLQTRIDEAYRDAKRDLEEALGPEGRKVAYVDSTRLATTWVTKRRVQINTDALLPWVQAHYPEHVEENTITTHTIYGGFLEAIKKATERAGEPCGPGGELDLPGVSLAPGYLAVRAADGGDELIAHLWQQGRLGTLDLTSTNILTNHATGDHA